MEHPLMAHLSYEARQAAEAAFHGTVFKIVQALPGAPNWVINSNNPQSARVSRPDGLELSFWFSGDRIEVRPAPPAGPNREYRDLRSWMVVGYNETAPSCTVAHDRKPEAAARDIDRKVLTPYKAMYAAILARKAEETKGQNAAEALAVEVATRLNRKRDLERHTPGHRYNISLYGRGSIYGDIEIAEHGGSAEARLRSMTPELLRKLVTWLEENCPEKAEA
jgi:hypothetical protein